MEQRPQQHSERCDKPNCTFQAGPFNTQQAVNAAMRAHINDAHPAGSATEGASPKPSK